MAHLTINSGPEQGRHYALDRMRTLHIGRGSGCEIMLTDPVSSRFHAVVFFEDGCWQLRDSKSRNGTRVNGKKVNHVVLDDKSRIHVGSTELQFFADSQEPIASPDIMQTVVADRSLLEEIEGAGGSGILVTSPAESGDLSDLYRLSRKLLKLEEPQEVIDTVLRVLRERTGADVAGVLWCSEGKRLIPERVLPAEAADRLQASRQLNRRVARQGEAVWVKNEQPGNIGELWSDGICVPLIQESQVIGAIHLYREQQHFADVDFEFSIAASQLLADALSRSRRFMAVSARNAWLVERNADLDELIGESAAMQRLKRKITRIGRANGAVLIRGESGVGKELVAAAIHAASARKKRPRLSVNCAAIPKDLIESQLFGHKKGAFTGADSDHAGWFQQAHTGTLFLDEIGELPLEGQAKLLRILEGHPFLPVGATKEIHVDVRVVAATNRDLAEFVHEGGFREDLYYRLSVFELQVPPLRERDEDIKLLIDHFLNHFRREHGRPNVTISDAAMQRLLTYPWPGNVRQLRNVIDSAIVMAEEDNIVRPEDLGLRDARLKIKDSLKLTEWEPRLIRTALDRVDGNVQEAASLLGISRATMYRKLKEYDIDRY